MKRRDGILASLALAASVVLMAELVASVEYAHAARSQAAGYQALFHELAGQPQATPLQAEKTGAALTGAALLVVGKVRQ
jgi:hypothetical protein